MVFTRRQAYEFALLTSRDGMTFDEDSDRDLDKGWFFPARYARPTIGGLYGVIVNKESGAVLPVGCGPLSERVFGYYDIGYQFERYDIVVLEVAQPDAAIDVLVAIAKTTDISYESDTVWRIQRHITRGEAKDRLTRLPCVIEDASLNDFTVPLLENANKHGVMRFRLLEYRQPR